MTNTHEAIEAIGATDDTVDHTGWSDSSARAVLQLIVESVVEMIGFEVAVLSVVLDGQLVTVAYAGPEEYHEYVMQSDPVSVLDPIVAKAETWGRFRFLAGEDYDDAELDGHWVVVAPEQGDEPDSWHPLDVLMAFLTDDEGSLVGALSVDTPTSGRRPQGAQRALLERYAAQSERAVVTAFERERLVQQVAHAEAARRLIRSASMPAQVSLDAVLIHTHEPLLEGFAASGSWIQVLDPHGPTRGHARNRHGEVATVSERMADLAHRLAPRMWREQRVHVIDSDIGSDIGRDFGRDFDRDNALAREARLQLAELGLASALAIPLGAGAECFGFLVLTRRAKDPHWSSVETSSALEIGHDLGTALMTALALERERNLVHELQQLDDYRSHLIATLSHELRTPLTVISGNLEMLGDIDHLEDDAARYHAAMTRGTQRMQRVVDDLLLLARVSDPQHPLERVPVDLHEVVAAIVSLVESTARTKGLVLDLQIGPGTLVVPGDATELDRLLANLVSNAVKYTPQGGAVTVSLTSHDDTAVVRISDNGLGISEEDQAGLFRAFFRTTNPDALREPGTGLGLAIVATIVERHGGTIDVSSRLGEGTTFTVTLPRD